MLVDPSVTLVGFNVHKSPEDGETDEERVMVPVNPLVGETVMVEFAVKFAGTVKLDGLAVIVKLAASPTL